MLRALQGFLGIRDDGLYQLQEAPHGLASRKNIRTGQKIMKIPRRCLIEASTLPFQNDDVEVNSRLALFLAREAQDKKSRWKPYLDSMPTKKDLLGHPMFLQGDDARALKETSVGKGALGNIFRYMESILRDHQTLLKKKRRLGFVPDWEDFLYYRILVSSRNFGYRRNGIDESGMVPYADLLNHSFKPNTVWYFDDASDCFVVEATEPIPAGKQIYDSYGQKPNNELFLYYGFTLPDNPNRIDHFNLDDSRKARRRKQAWLKKTRDPNVRRLLTEELG
ncbi:SET domain-containing protein-lysine N-methyltransferase [bacterium]|nr:SET domain-containing protein-lysine N-methyltransferase [bacterium]